eukprot:485387-Rhodomonas_salina.2
MTRLSTRRLAGPPTHVLVPGVAYGGGVGGYIRLVPDSMGKADVLLHSSDGRAVQIRPCPAIVGTPSHWCARTCHADRENARMRRADARRAKIREGG